MDTELKVKDEIERLLKAGFIRLAIYADWLANIVPVLKRKTGAVRICVDYRNLNEASPKDEYPMPMADMLVDGAAHNQMLSFMDGNAGYNQIMMAEQDVHKTTFMCPGHIGAFEYTALHAATHYLHHCQDRLNQIHANKTNAEGQNWEMDFGFDRIHLQTDKASGAEIVLEEPLGVRHCYSFQLDFQCTNNRAEYEALIIGLEMLVELGIQSVEILGDSMLVLKQIAGEYKCLNPSLAVYLVAARNLLTEFKEATWEHIPREENFTANELAQVASGVQMPEDCVQRIIKIGRKSLPSVLTRGMEIEVNSALITEDDWREPIMTYLRYPTLPSKKRVRIMATSYLMWNEDLVRKSKDEVLLRCLGKTEYMKVMGETHEGICGAHQGGRKMCWLIRRYGYFWQTMMKDCINYSKGCEAYQRHGPIQQAPSVPMNPVVKPWPFRGWAMDLIGKIYPASNQQHCFIIVATDYFTKWVEAKPVKTTTSQEIITFIEEQIIQRTSKREATGMTPYALTYGHDAILPMEIAVQSLRVAHQHGLTGEDYSQAMLLELEELDASRIDTLNKLLAGKQAVSRAYNKRVRNKSFEEGEIVWKAILLLGAHIAGYGKWSPTWEGPFIINQILGMGAYRLQD
ncbi:uncharacterized protein LOC109946532 [Prunus persica]|uniref:uncharacterized protein LOC109946532 n=1 Tax=Prunus persica TaxID=3760 RepID=UPI0009AB553F|nr:uncharacterized protein LOC109946532 [Prunus persica]